MRDVAGINAGARTNVAGIEAGWRGGAQQGQQYATDVAADVAIMTSPDASPQDKIAAAQRVAAARGGAVSQESDAGRTTTELPPEELARIDSATPAEAERALRNRGVSESSIREHLQRRNQPGWWYRNMPDWVKERIFGIRPPVQLKGDKRPQRRPLTPVILRS